MIQYKVTETPVLVRSAPTSDGNVVNVIPVNSTIYVISETEGWMKTSAGYYIFKTDNLERQAPVKMMRSLANSNTLSSAGDGTGQGAAARDYSQSWSSDPRGGNFVPSKTQSQSSSSTLSGGIPPVGDWQPPPQTEPIDSARSSPLSNRDAALSDKYDGMKVKTTQIIKTDDQGNPIRDAAGNYEYISAPDELSRTDGMNSIIEVGSDGLMRVRDNNGNIYLVNGAQGGVQIADVTNNGDFSWSTFTLQQENSFIDQVENIVQDIMQGAVLTDPNINKATVADSSRIFGMPYQFLPSVDRRIVGITDNSENQDPFSLIHYGRKFQDKIVARAPLLYMQPGLPVFLKQSRNILSKSLMELLFLQQSPNGS